MIREGMDVSNGRAGLLGTWGGRRYQAWCPNVWCYPISYWRHVLLPGGVALCGIMGSMSLVVLVKAGFLA